MALVYFDASAFVKLLTDEPGSDTAAALWDGCDAAVSSRLAYPEVRAALAAARRNRDLSEGELAAAERDWDEYWGATRPVELTPTVTRHAGELARDHALRGATTAVVGHVLIIDGAGDRRIARSPGGQQPAGLPLVLRHRRGRVMGVARRL